MTAGDDEALAAEIEDVLRREEGVAFVNRSGSVFSRLVDAGARALGIRDAALVALRRDDDGLHIEASLGVDAGHRADATVRGAHGAIRSLLEERGVAVAEIRLTVVYIDENVSNGEPR